MFYTSKLVIDLIYHKDAIFYLKIYLPLSLFNI